MPSVRHQTQECHSPVRVDRALVERGLARSRTHAGRLLAAGRVLADGTAVTKPSQPVGPDAHLSLTETAEPEFVSRAGHKLAGALAVFGVDVAGRRCLDAGASTGGFTDVLLRAGAGQVVAVDVGHGQLVDSLRADRRVDVHEGMNVRYLDPGQIGGPVDLTVGDLSFISLTLVMSALAAVTVPGGDLVLMVKPQFEVGRERLSRTGVVTSDAERLRAVTSVLNSALDVGLDIRATAVSPLPGQDGNLEYFLWLKMPMSDPVPRIEEERDPIIAEALRPLTSPGPAPN